MKWKNQAVNMKYKCIKPEDVKTDQLLSFSFNPVMQPSFTSFYKMKLNNLKDWSEQQQSFFRSLKYCNIMCYTEISSGGRLHMHGWIMILDPVRFYLSTIRHIRENGTYEIDVINDNVVWTSYVFKMKKQMLDFCKKENMIYEYTM